MSYQDKPTYVAEQTRYYKIRRKSDGKFSTGGTWPTFEDGGKVWKKLNHLRCHMTLVKDNIDSENRRYRARTTGAMRKSPYENCEIIECVYSLEVVNTIPI